MEPLEILKKLKSQSGSHSPSIETILENIPSLNIKIDACFLSNPYATDLFMKYLENDLIKTNKLREVLEFYPPQNHDVANTISKAIKVNPENLFVGNGAIEIIQAIIHNFVESTICVTLPTFSSYYEFVKLGINIVHFKLSKENDFEFNPEKYVKFVIESKADTVAIINPNNPDGGYITRDKMNYIFESLRHLKNIIIDESFIHFAYEDVELSQLSSEELINKYSNLIILKSMSKDFGIAGVRAGYAVMSKPKVDYLLKYGYLWNISGLANYFFRVYSNPEFISEYHIVRKKYIMNTQMFMNELIGISGIKVYPSKANFALIEITNGKNSFDFAMELLLKEGIYVRDCSDKTGLDGQFIRVASRTFEENLKIIQTLKEIN